MTIRDFLADRLDEAPDLPAYRALRTIFDNHEGDRANDDADCQGCGYDPLKGGAAKRVGSCPDLRAIAHIWTDHPDHPDNRARTTALEITNLDRNMNRLGLNMRGGMEPEHLIEQLEEARRQLARIAARIDQ
ncbi:hypothetical protein HNR23_002310 [Nocardiopsis mwathae]|uniref:Uncharacterized protein n=1 Tax=Nocardiopsis mwathae TaxID=1472723 RepID=A0A7X0D5I6_9ACTN|nr:hypothetical protein [Nocardiopsis mwathae]MBB6172250.1 hypothetical protein [Nocardiopsis mwathae]